MIADLTRDNIEKTMFSIGKRYKARKKKVKESNLLKEDIKKYENEELYFCLHVDGVEHASKALFEDLVEVLDKVLHTIPRIKDYLEITEYQSFRGSVCTSYQFQKEREPAKTETFQMQQFQPQAQNLGNIPEGSLTMEKVAEMLEKQRFDMEHAQLKKDLEQKKEDLQDAYKEIEKLENQLNIQASAALELGRDAKIGNKIMNGIEKSLPALGATVMPIIMKNETLMGILNGFAQSQEAQETQNNKPGEDNEDEGLTDEQEGLLSWGEQLSASLGADNFQKVTIICNVLAQTPEKIATVMDVLK